MYNQCLKTGVFPKIWKVTKIVPVIKPGKENSKEATKYRPISLINICGKILDKLVIDRVMHHLHKEGLLSKNQFGFTPQKCTTDAIMEVKNI